MGFISLLLALVGVCIIVAAVGVGIYIVRNVSAKKGAIAGITSAQGTVRDVRELEMETGRAFIVTIETDPGVTLELQTTPTQARVIYPGQSGTVHFAERRLTGWVPAVGGVQDSFTSE